MICIKCGQRYVADYRCFHDPLKCEDCQPQAGEPNDIEAEQALDGLFETEYELGGEA